MSINRARVRECLRDYFETEDFSDQDHLGKDEDKGSTTMMMKYIIKALFLPSVYEKKGKERDRLRSVVNQEVNLMSQRLLCKRVRWGRYRPRN